MMLKPVTDFQAMTLTHTFSSSRLDYCNVLYCIAEGLLSHLQSVQNVSSRLVTGLGRREHITPALWQLRVSVRQCVVFKLATLVYSSLAGTAPAYLSLAYLSPAYLSDECHLTWSVGVRSLRSADCLTCVPRRAHNGYSVRCFATAGLSLWYSLPLHLREPTF